MLGVYLTLIDNDSDQKVFEALYTAYKNMMYNVAYGVIHDVQLSEDAVMNSFFVLARNMEQIAEHSLEENLNDLRRLKSAYPNKVLIASIMGTNEEDWTELARLVTEAGADMIFITVPPRPEDMQRIADLPFPVCTSIVEGTVNEDFTVDQLAKMGFKLVKFPQTLIRASMRAMHDVLQSLRETGGTKAYRDSIATQKQRGEYTHIGEWSDFQAKIEKKDAFKVDE